MEKENLSLLSDLSAQQLFVLIFFLG